MSLREHPPPHLSATLYSADFYLHLRLRKKYLTGRYSIFQIRPPLSKFIDLQYFTSSAAIVRASTNDCRLTIKSASSIGQVRWDKILVYFRLNDAPALRDIPCTTPHATTCMHTLEVLSAIAC